MKVNELLEGVPTESELGKQIRAIAAKSGLTAKAHQMSSWIVLASKKHTRAKFAVRVRGDKGMSREEREAEFYKRTDEFIADLLQYLKSLGNEVKFACAPTGGKLRDNWIGRNLDDEMQLLLSKDEKKIAKSIAFMRLTSSMGTQKERLDASWPEAWIEFRIITG